MDRTVNATFIALHHAADAQPALCAALDLDSSAVPEWVHLLPAGEIRTMDGRGPYSFKSAQSLIASSLPKGERLVIDINHATDLAAPKGGDAPAMGWIVELEGRADGIWGKVEWTGKGRELVEGKAYRALSPVISHDKQGHIGALLRASLVNRPNLKGLTTLHHEDAEMTLLEKLRKAFGLDDSASEDAVIAAATSLHQAQQAQSVALQAQIDPIATAAGLQAGATAEQIVAAIGNLGNDGNAGETIQALQSELTTMAGELKSLRDGTARDKATAFVDGAIQALKVGVKPLREHYITRHMANPAEVEKEIGALPSLAGGSTVLAAPPAADGSVSLNAEQRQIATMLGLSEEAYAETLKVERANEEAV